jgi:catechol 2,3-dioxygenase-like lactoylglutathione lyase family enzyme
MTPPWTEALRSVALNLPDLAKAEAFYTDVWKLSVAARGDNVVYLRGTGADHHLLALHAGGPAAQIRHLTFRARSNAALGEIEKASIAAGGSIAVPLCPLDDPAGGIGLMLRDPDGRLIQLVHGDQRHSDVLEQKDHPMRLAHVVLNAHDLPASQRFFEQALGFRLVDRTRIMAFLNCNRDHHSLALGDADNDALNHIAFVMPEVDSVMRGGGRMKDAGHSIEWGPGRHGPGNNAFNYFIDPFGVVIEYTADVQQIDESYRIGTPDDWKWPAGRVDHWGISAPPSARLKEAQRAVFFAPSASGVS